MPTENGKPKSIVSTNGEPILCPLCWTQINNRALTDTCFHEFCFDCLKEWSEVPHNTCPFCRQKYENIVVNIQSDVHFELIPVLPFDLAFIEQVGEELLGELYDRDEYPEVGSGAINTNGMIALKIKEILEMSGNEWSAVEMEVIFDSQSLLIEFTENILKKTSASDHILDMTEEIVLSILRVKFNEFIDYFKRISYFGLDLDIDIQETSDANDRGSDEQD